MVDYSGHLAAVVFVRGCNFSCGFCHNPELMGPVTPGMSWQNLEIACRRFRDEWVDAAVITGGEPTLAGDLPGLIRVLKGFGWNVKLDTNGSRPGMLARCLPLVDYVAMDIKTGLEGYPALTGFRDIDCLRQSVDLIKDGSGDYEFRTTLIEGVHDDAQIESMQKLIEGARRYVLQAFVPSGILPDARFREMRRTPAGFLETTAARFEGWVDEVVIRGG